MEYDETELIDFFGVVPEEQDPEEREFFGSCAFELRRGHLTLRISFSSTHPPKVIADLLDSADGTLIVRVKVREAAAVRVEHTPRRLSVLAALERTCGNDPPLAERLAITLDPLSVAVSD